MTSQVNGKSMSPDTLSGDMACTALLQQGRQQLWSNDATATPPSTFVSGTYQLKLERYMGDLANIQAFKLQLPGVQENAEVRGATSLQFRVPSRIDAVPQVEAWLVNQGPPIGTEDLALAWTILPISV